MKTKRCPKCGISKTVDQFHKSSNSKDGLYCYCKECRKVIQHKIYVKRKGKEEVKQNLNPINVLENPLSEFTPVQLINELRKRGYYGELSILQKVKV